MGSPEQDPRSLPPAGAAVHVSPVMAGMEWVDPNGLTRIAANDIVLVELIDQETGTASAVVAQSADGALALAIMIQNAAVKLINAEVNDKGEKLGPLQRMARISNAYKEAQ